MKTDLLVGALVGAEETPPKMTRMVRPRSSRFRPIT